MTIAARCSTLALCLAAAPALALTPEELWSAWQAQVAGFGATITAEAVPGPDGSLVLRSFVATAPGGPPEPMPPDSPVREVRLAPTGDGGVAIDLGLGEGRTVPLGAEGDVRVDTPGLAFIARDDAAAPGAIAYELGAERLTVALMPPAAGAPAPDGAAGGSVDFGLEVAAPAIRVGGGTGAGQTLTAEVSLDGLAYVFDMADPYSGMSNRQASRAEGTTTFTVAVTMPAGQGLAELGAALQAADQLGPEGDAKAALAVMRALRDGAALRLDFASEPGTQAAWFTGFPFDYRYESRSEGGTGRLGVDGSGAALTAGVGGGSFTASSSALPFASLDATFGASDLEISVPLGPAEGDWRYRVSLGELTVNEEAWAYLDPDGRLGREPARFVMDLGGRATLDALGLAEVEAAGGTAPPPEIASLEIRQAEVAAAGVRATAGGTLSFDNRTGAPVPVGTLTARVEGLDRLIDAAVALGWVAPEDARNARLGLATVFRAGDEPDVRETAIEFRADGSVLANGVQVQ